jgi:hypothetical protein
MPINLNCPSCQKALRVADNLAGQKCKCPQCGTVFLVPVTPVTGVVAQPSPPAPPVFVSPPTTQTTPQAAPPPPPDGAPPPARSRRKPLILGGVAAAVLVALCAGCGISAYLTSGFGLMSYFRSSPLTDDLKYMPDNTQVITTARVDQLLSSSAWQDLKKEIPEIDAVFEKQALPGAPGELKPGDVAQVTGGATLDGKEAIIVVHAKKEFTPDEIKKSVPGGSVDEVKTPSGFTIYDAKGQGYFISDKDKKVLVQGKTEVLRKVLERNGKPALSDGMQAALKLADFSSSMAFAVCLKDAKLPGADPTSAVPLSSDMVKGGEVVAKDIDMIAGQVHFSSDIDVATTLVCKDAKAAEDYRKLVEGSLVLTKKLTAFGLKNDNAIKGVSDIVDAMKAASSGNKVTFKGKCKPADIVNVYKEAKKDMPAGPKTP